MVLKASRLSGSRLKVGSGNHLRQEKRIEIAGGREQVGRKQAAVATGTAKFCRRWRWRQRWSCGSVDTRAIRCARD